MQLNLPILDQLAESKNILIAGAGGGFDVYCGLPLYFTLRELGKNVHLANYTTVDFDMARLVSEPQVLSPDLVIGICGQLKHDLFYFPEGHLAEWFSKERQEAVTIWMLAHTGGGPLAEAYAGLTAHLDIDAVILVDGGIDSLMRGNESAPGSMVEDTLSLAAVEALNISVKILACLGFGSEVEEQISHYHALENMAALAAQGAFLGSCALTPQMEAFQLYESAGRYAWDNPQHEKSHISTRVIPAVHGEFGNHRMYEARDLRPSSRLFISPLMSLYWFFTVAGVASRNLVLEAVRHTTRTQEAFSLAIQATKNYPLRQRQLIPY